MKTLTLLKLSIHKLLICMVYGNWPHFLYDWVKFWAGCYKTVFIDESEHFLITGMYTCLVKNLYWRRSLSKTKIYFLFSRACESINWLSKGYSLNLLAFCRACLNSWMLAVVHLCPLPVIWLGCSGLFLCVTISVVFVTNCFLLCLWNNWTSLLL